MMDKIAEIAATMGQLFDCSEVNGFIRIRTPYLYPDGDVIDLFFRTQGEQQILTDLGETLRWLNMQTVSQQLTKRQSQVLQDIQLTHGVENYQGMLLIRIAQGKTLSETVTHLAQAVMAECNHLLLVASRKTGETMQLDLDSFEYSNPRGVLTFHFYCWIGDTITIHKHGQVWPESVLKALQNAAKEYSWLKVDTIVDDFVQVRSSRPILKVAEAIAAQFESEGIKVHRIIFSSPDRKHEASTFW